MCRERAPQDPGVRKRGGPAGLGGPPLGGLGRRRLEEWIFFDFFYNFFFIFIAFVWYEHGLS